MTNNPELFEPTMPVTDEHDRAFARAQFDRRIRNFSLDGLVHLHNTIAGHNRAIEHYAHHIDVTDHSHAMSVPVHTDKH